MMSAFFQFQHILFFNNCKGERGGGGGGGGGLEVNLRKLSEVLNLMGFTDPFYKEISFHFLQRRLFHSTYYLKVILSAV